MIDIRVSKCIKSYGPNHVLKGVNLEIGQGEFVVLLGPSGCGKSTLLHIIAGLEPLTSGTIEIGGKDVTDAEPKDREIAMVFQSYALYPTMSVRENMGFGLRMRGTSAKDVAAIVEEKAKMLQIDHLLDRKPGQLSGGQRQRVAIGRALVRHPRVYLFDEPLSNLDAKLRTGMRMEIKKLHQRLGTTAIYVTHDQLEAMTLATKLVVMKGGEIQQVGTPDEVYNQPVNLFVADFLGSPGMNFLKGSLRKADNGIFARIHGEDIPLESYPFRAHPEDDQPIVLGVRPEAVRRARPGQSGYRLDLPPVVVENTGADKLVSLQFGDEEIIARVKDEADRPVTVGHKLPVSIDLGRLNVFAQASGVRL